MNPHAAQPASPAAMLKSLWGNRELIAQMTRREVVGRYKGSVSGESQTQFAVILFAGMTVHALFAEVLNRAPGIILGNVNYVKKVVFPLEILAVVSLGAALFHALVSLLVLLVAFATLNGFVHWTAIFAPFG